MTEKEVIEQIESLIDDRNSFIDPTDKREDNIFRKDKEALQTVLKLLEQKDKRIDELEKALVEEDLKHRDKINKIKNKLREVQDYNLNWKDEMVFKFVMEILEE